MGYSCTQDATFTLGVICHMFAKGDSSNTLTIKGQQYFFERGREQADGAITGPLFLMLDNGYARPAGSYRINGDGSIARFPGLTRDEKKEAETTVRDMRARNPHLLHAWAMGRI